MLEGDTKIEKFEREIFIFKVYFSRNILVNNNLKKKMVRDYFSQGRKAKFVE